MQIKKPLFWDFKKPNLLSNLLKIFSFPLIIKNKIKFNKIKIKGIKSICVGNIYVGGTGKTPASISIYREFRRLKLKSILIKKYYRDQKDERLLLKKNGILISKKKRIDAIKLAKLKKFKYAIFDDGLQDKEIDYDVKIVCFNYNSFIGNGLIIPAGPLREKLESLKYYQVAIINGNGENIKKLKNQLKRFNKNLKIYKGEYVFDKRINSKNKKFIAVSGIGNNYTFLQTLKKNNFKVIKNFQYPDHYNYKNKDIIKLRNEAKNNNCRLITTEKDFLRLSKKQQKSFDVFRIILKINGMRELINYLKKNENN